MQPFNGANGLGLPFPFDNKAVPGRRIAGGKSAGRRGGKEDCIAGLIVVITMA